MQEIHGKSRKNKSTPRQKTEFPTCSAQHGFAKKKSVRAFLSLLRKAHGTAFLAIPTDVGTESQEPLLLQ